MTVKVLVLFVLFSVIVFVDSVTDLRNFASEIDAGTGVGYFEQLDGGVPKEERPLTPRRCCKVGRRVAAKRLYCNIDLYQIEKKFNEPHRQKAKWQGQDESLARAVYKGLMLKVEKCYPRLSTRNMFTKCCQYQENIEKQLDDCRELFGEERLKCEELVLAR